MAVDLEKLREVLRNKTAEFFGDKILSIEINPQKELVLNADREIIRELCRMLHDNADFHFDHLGYLTGIDNSSLGIEPRFTIIYQLASTTKLHKMRVRAGVPEDDPQIDSVVSIWDSANFMEREAFDMFGVIFRDHPDLRRILMPEDWEGYPLRKDFPLGGVKSFYFKRATDPHAGEPKNLVPRIRTQRSDI